MPNLLGTPGRLVILAALHRTWGFEPGDTLVAHLEEGPLDLALIPRTLVYRNKIGSMQARWTATYSLRAKTYEAVLGLAGAVGTAERGFARHDTPNPPVAFRIPG